MRITIDKKCLKKVWRNRIFLPDARKSQWAIVVIVCLTNLFSKKKNAIYYYLYTSYILLHTLQLIGQHVADDL